MTQSSICLFDLPAADAREHMLKSSSYFDLSLPEWFNFSPLLESAFEEARRFERKTLYDWGPQKLDGINYQFLSNKDGKFLWRPFELINPFIYGKAVETITEEGNWAFIKDRLSAFAGGKVHCCSHPVVSTGAMGDTAEQILKWWHTIEQRSLELSLEYSHVAITDVTNCYPSIYTHSIAWALHGKEFMKEGNNRSNPTHLGNQLDQLMTRSRGGQTNGLPQASILSHILAELVLGYCDSKINERLADDNQVRILRYRDDYRIFGLSDTDCDEALKIVSEELHHFGMRLGAAKTSRSFNLVSAAVKPEKLAALQLSVSQKTIQKQLLVIHQFALENPGAGALKTLLKDFLALLATELENPRYEHENKLVIVAILMDIVAVAPIVIPPVARAVSLVLQSLPEERRTGVFALIGKKVQRIPNSGYLDLWVQRMALPANLEFQSDEKLCQSIDGDAGSIWNFDWIKDKGAREKLSNFSVVDQTIIGKATPVIPSSEIDDFWKDGPSF